MPDRIPDAELREVLEYCEAATEGPWETIFGEAIKITAGDGNICTITHLTNQGRRNLNECGANARLFARSRTDLPRVVKALQAANVREAEHKARVAELEKKDEQVCALIAESQGVDGLHLNGDVATWEELMHGFHMHAWLNTYADDFPLAAREEKSDAR